MSQRGFNLDSNIGKIFFERCLPLNYNLSSSRDRRCVCVKGGSRKHFNDQILQRTLRVYQLMLYLFMSCLLLSIFSLSLTHTHTHTRTYTQVLSLSFNALFFKQVNADSLGIKSALIIPMLPPLTTNFT